jgi:hypothetical protein
MIWAAARWWVVRRYLRHFRGSLALRNHEVDGRHNRLTNCLAPNPTWVCAFA